MLDRRQFVASTLGASSLLVTPARAGVAAQNASVDLDVTSVPGIAAAGEIDGKPFQLAAGLLEAGKPGAVTIDTVFPALSMTKTVFAMAVRSLVRDGKLDLDKPLQDYADLGLTGEARQITAAHVLTHSTGLVNWRFKPDQPLVSAFLPGSRWQYSGEGIFLLQRAVEAITGVSAATVVRQRVLDPLRMTSSSFLWRRTPDVPAAVGHDRAGARMEKSLEFYAQKNLEILDRAGIATESATYDQIVAAYAKAGSPALPIGINPNMAGSLYTTPRDFAKYLRATMPELAATPQVRVNSAIAWSRGWGVEGDAFFHMGDAPGFKSFAWIKPKRKTFIAFFTNGERGQSLYSWEFRKVLGKDAAALYWI